uniref:Uncharacterized protein n=1 Tax=Oryza nivara TaxID=4536 RepID=A0A0E0GBA6_ORYNI
MSSCYSSGGEPPAANRPCGGDGGVRRRRQTAPDNGIGGVRAPSATAVPMAASTATTACAAYAGRSVSGGGDRGRIRRRWWPLLPPAQWSRVVLTVVASTEGGSGNGGFLRSLSSPSDAVVAVEGGSGNMGCKFRPATFMRFTTH